MLSRYFSRFSFKQTLQPLISSKQFSHAFEDASYDLKPTKTIHEIVKEYYGKILSTSKDLKTNACTSGPPPLSVKKAINNIPSEIRDKYYGCGSPIPNGINGKTILDLGSGSGQDCYIASQFVGENGKVIGIDMTNEQLSVANKYVDQFCKNTMGYKQSNIEFKQGYIEFIDEYVDSNSIDLVISNCVVNLSPRKDQVLKGVWNCLKYGGEFYFSDVYCDRRLSNEIRNNKILYGECLGGALYIEDFRRLCQNIGFLDPRILNISEIKVTDNELNKILGNAKFYSITYRLFKLQKCEDKCEDYGQIGIYNGGIIDNENYYDLDDHHRFYKNKPMLICGNTAEMIGNTWLKPYFNVVGEQKEHFGLFDCSPVNVSSNNNNDNSNVGSGCC